jgi:predicted ATP-grasp superfamily ATP-dependent carboligase
MSKNIMFIGGGIETFPGIEICKKRKYKTIIVDGNKNCFCKKYADYFIKASIYDFKKVLKKTKNFNNKIKIHAVLSLGTDVPYTVSYVAQNIDCASIPLSAAKICSDKLKFKNKMIRHKILTPKYLTVKNIEDLKKVKFKKTIIKPVDSRGARGVQILTKRNLKQIFIEAKKHTKKKYMLAEEFLNGPQLSTESVIINFKAKTVAISDRNYKDTKIFYPHVIENGSDMPSKYQEKYKKKINILISKLAKCLNIKYGIIKGDLLINKNKIYIIEAAPRLSGGFFCSDMLPLCNGIKIIEVYLDLLLFGVIQKDALKEKFLNFVSQRFFFGNRGKIKEIIIPKKLYKMSKKIIFYKKIDDYQPLIKSHPDRTAMLICSDSSRMKVKKKITSLVNSIKIKNYKNIL